MVHNYLRSSLHVARFFFLLTALITSGLCSHAQTITTVPAGNPVGGSSSTPLAAWWGYERTVITYEGGASGHNIPGNQFITAVGFYLQETNTPLPTQAYNCKIYMKEVTSPLLTSDTYDNHKIGATLVYDGLLQPSLWTTINQWKTITLQTCFVYQTTGNAIKLLIETNYALPPTNDGNGYFGSPDNCPSNVTMFRTHTAPQASIQHQNTDFSPPSTAGTVTSSGRPNVQFTYVPATPCNTSMPTNYTPSSTDASVCAGVPFTISLPGLPCVGGLTYQWYANTGSGFLPIPGATNSTLTTTQSVQTTYHCVISCSGTALPPTPSITINQNTYLSCYCPASATSTADTDLGNVKIGAGAGIINVGSSSPIYQNPTAGGTYTNNTAVTYGPFQQGVTYPFTLTQITTGTFFYSAYFHIFIDWNKDGFLDPLNERVYSGGPTTSTGSPNTPSVWNVSGSFQIPFTSQLGVTRMRIIIRETAAGGNLTNPPCGNFTWGEVEDYNINITAGAACNLTNPGDAVSSPSFLCSGDDVTLSITGNTTMGSFQTWQWQACTQANYPNFTDIPGANTTPWTISGQAVNMIYRCVLTCPTGGTMMTDTVLVPMALPTQCYCPPPYGSACAGNHISNVTFNMISNSTGCSSGNGTSWTIYPASGATTTNVTQNSTYNLSVSTNGTTSAIISVWFDWDRDGQFEPNEWIQLATNNPVGSTVTVPVTVPIIAGGAGLTGMRVRSRSSGNVNTSTSACLQFFSGEAEDYFINVIAYTPPNCGIQAPANLPVLSTTAPLNAPCSGTPFTLSLGNLNNPPVNGATTGYTYQWQYNQNGAGWFNIPGAPNASSYVASQTVNTQYRVQYGCGFVGVPVLSNTISITNTANYWKGVNNNWADGVNWCTGPPTINDDVLISRTQPGVASPYFTPVVSVSDTVKAKNLTIAVNDTVMMYTDTLNAFQVGQTMTVNGKFIVRTAVSDTCCINLYSGTSPQVAATPFKLAYDHRFQMMFIQSEFAGLPNLGGDDMVTHLSFPVGSAPPGANTFNNLNVKWGWIPSADIEYTGTDMYPAPYIGYSGNLNLTGITAGQNILIPMNNFKWRTDSNLVIEICWDNLNPGSVSGNYVINVTPNLGRKVTMSNTALSGVPIPPNGCSMEFGDPFVNANGGAKDVRPNVRFIFGRKSKKLNLPIGNDLIVNSTGLVQTIISTLTVGDSINNFGTIKVDSTAITVNSAVVNSGTFDMNFAFESVNRLNSLTVGGSGLFNTGSFIPGASPVTISGANFDNSGTWTPGTSTVYFTGTGAQSIGGSSATSIYRLSLKKGTNAQIVTLNNPAFTVIDSINLVTGSIDLNQNTLTFNNPSVLTFRPSATTSGFLLANHWDSRLKWNIGTTPGVHIFPFLKPPAPATGTTGFVGVEINNVAGAGDNIGEVTVGTYATAADNTPLPPVWHINNALGLNHSATTVDRFWYIERGTPPTGSGNTQITFTTLTAERPATIPTASMRAQPYYEYTMPVGSPPPSVRAAWAPPPGTQVSSGFSPLRTTLNGYTWPVAFGSSNPWAISHSTNPLPIELMYFDATLKGSSVRPEVLLTWGTATEADNDYFTIERTLDFNTVIEIDRVKSRGNSNEVQHYQTLDYEPVIGRINYYRLKQTDFNGTFTYHDNWVPVRIGKGEAFTIQYIKNADQLEVMFEYDTEGPVTVNVTDMTGRIMFSESGFGAVPGLNLLPINAGGWAEGVYVITLQDNERQVSHKIFY